MDRWDGPCPPEIYFSEYNPIRFYGMAIPTCATLFRYPQFVRWGMRIDLDGQTMSEKECHFFQLCTLITQRGSFVAFLLPTTKTQSSQMHLPLCATALPLPTCSSRKHHVPRRALLLLLVTTTLSRPHQASNSQHPLRLDQLFLRVLHPNLFPLGPSSQSQLPVILLRELRCSVPMVSGIRLRTLRTDLLHSLERRSFLKILMSTHQTRSSSLRLDLQPLLRRLF
ncbi:hypothetical protein K435DRAFT_518848 [Dendrothele bispora CBS 962.96]|uniref:Uncharacterized protein n=1 Tax=Dendrothele bispora (strain CBS 962.96) TaxID=1314807 RepID=A0A4S8M8Z7_DENBC|nr:hypothetical protein K435DRAFT_518848 [Dendrothele bispora CBS 962.96]